MTFSSQQVGVVVVMEKDVVSGLAKLAQRHQWPLIHLPTATQAMKTLGRQRVDVAVIHVAMELQQTLQFIQWLRMTRQGILLVAVASAHHEETERAVRHAGAHCYLPQTDEVSLERAIAEILQQEAGQGGPRELIADTHATLRGLGQIDIATARRRA